MRKEGFKVKEKVTLEPYERDHAVVTGTYRAPPKKKIENEVNDLNNTNELKNNDKCWKIYQEYFYNSSGKTLDEILNNARSNTKNVLKEMNPNDRLIFLNFIKYSLQMEQRAYKQDSIYANALKKIGKPFDKEDLPDFSKIMHAKEKIELVEKMLADEIKQQRKSLKNLLPDRI